MALTPLRVHNQHPTFEVIPPPQTLSLPFIFSFIIKPSPAHLGSARAGRICKVHVVQPEAHVVPVGPLEVIKQAPREVTLQWHAILRYSFRGCLQVLEIKGHLKVGPFQAKKMRAEEEFEGNVNRKRLFTKSF